MTEPQAAYESVALDYYFSPFQPFGPVQQLSPAPGLYKPALLIVQNINRFVITSFRKQADGKNIVQIVLWNRAKYRPHLVTKDGNKNDDFISYSKIHMAVLSSTSRVEKLMIHCTVPMFYEQLFIG